MYKPNCARIINNKDYKINIIFDDFRLACVDLVNRLVGGCTEKVKMAIILPTGQWCALSAVINDAWYCRVLHGIALYCIVLQGIAWYCIVLHGIALYCMVLQGIALYCRVLHGIAWYCMVLHGFA